MMTIMFGAEIVGTAAAATLAHATTPGKNGLIAFTRYRLQNAPIWSEIFVARPDGSAVRRVSHLLASSPSDDEK